MRTLAAVAAVLLSARASAQTFPARSGETGILDVPDAQTTGAGGGQLGLEFRFDHSKGAPNDLGPLPIYAVGGISDRLDLGLTMREWGQPDDARPARVTFGAAAKLQLAAPAGPIPGFALSAVFDRFNARGIVGARAVTSTSKLPMRFSGFIGTEGEAKGLVGLGLTAGLAGTIPFSPALDLAAEALIGPRGPNYGLALRWAATSMVGVFLGGNYLPDDEGFRVALGFAFFPPSKGRIVKPAPIAGKAEEKEPSVATGPRFTDPRPRFRLRVPVSGVELHAAARHQQYGPYVPTLAGGVATAQAAPTGARATAPSLQELAEAQVREQEAFAEARDRRVRATAEQLEARERTASNDAGKADQREKDLSSREQQLDLRDKHIAVRGPPSQQQRQLESLEAQLASQERNLGAQERSYGPALDAAQGRERDAEAREDADRQTANRLAASAGGAASPAMHLELRKQALAARNRQLAAAEARLVAKGERIDALERQLRTKSERLDTWSRRLDARAERLDLLEKRATEARPPPAAPAPADPGATEPRDRPVFVMVVKSPTAILKEDAAAAPAPGVTAVHPGVAVEKAVAAATVAMFPTPATALSELDREAIDSIAKLAAKERCEVLIWARAKDPGLMAEAQRRAGEIRARVLSAGPLDEKQVVTRITTRPGARGVDVVVSALRETAKPAAPAAPADPGAPRLSPGESGKRQIREAVQAAQGSIEICVGAHIEATRAKRAEGVLRLTVSTRGKVSHATTAGGDLAGAELEECLARASGAWIFPAAEADYVVDVPITVMRGGAAK